jgi:hypothetical protein
LTSRGISTLHKHSTLLRNARLCALLALNNVAHDEVWHLV